MTTPLDRILRELGLANHALVEAYRELGGRISHKTIQKARSGKRALTRHMQTQVVEALNACVKPEIPYRREQLFGDACFSEVEKRRSRGDSLARHDDFDVARGEIEERSAE